LDPKSYGRVLDLSVHTILGQEVEVKAAFSKEEAFDVLVAKKDKKIYLPHLPDEATEEILFDHFKKFGEIESVQILLGTRTTKKLNYGFITYYDQESLQEALLEGSTQHIKELDQTVRIFK
jgi:RNA recognition motif-containing protein